MESRPSKKRKLENNLIVESYHDIDLLNEISKVYELFDNKKLERCHLETLFNNVLSNTNKIKKELEEYKSLSSPKKNDDIGSNGTSFVPNLNEEKCVTSFENIRFDSPKGKMFIEIYPSFMKVTQQSKKNEKDVNADNNASIIPYRDIKSIIHVPYSHGNHYLYIQFNKTITLTWRKTEIDCIAMIFEDKSTIELKNIQNVNLSNELSGTTDSILCELLTKLSSIPIQIQNKKIFVSALNPKKHYIEGSVGPINGFIYPLEHGIFFLCQPKPIQYIELKNIESYEYAKGRGMNTGLRYFDLNINVQNCQKAIQISMIPIKEISSLHTYFSQCRIQCVANNEEKKNKNSQNPICVNGNNKIEDKIDSTNNNNNDNNNNNNHNNTDNNNANNGCIKFDDNSSDDSSFNADEEMSDSNLTEFENDEMDGDEKLEKDSIDNDCHGGTNNDDKKKLCLRSRAIERKDNTNSTNIKNHKKKSVQKQSKTLE